MLWAREIKITGNGENQQSLSPYKFKCIQKVGTVPLPQNVIIVFKL